MNDLVLGTDSLTSFFHLEVTRYLDLQLWLFLCSIHAHSGQVNRFLPGGMSHPPLKFSLASTVAQPCRMGAICLHIYFSYYIELFGFKHCLKLSASSRVPPVLSPGLRAGILKKLSSKRHVTAASETKCIYPNMYLQHNWRMYQPALQTVEIMCA